MAQPKLNEADETFLQLPREAALIFSGASGAETWIERETDRVVRIGIMSVATANGEDACLEVSIEIDGAQAKGKDGPVAAKAQLRASQAVQVMVKAGERLAIKAYPTVTRAAVLRTVVWAGDLPPPPQPKTDGDADPNRLSRGLERETAH